MAWTLDSVHELVQHPQTLKWYLRVLLSDGARQQLEAIKFQTEPTEPQQQAAITATLKRLNDGERIAGKERKPPNVGNLLTAGQRDTLQNSVLILESVIPAVDADIRLTFRQWVADYREKLEKYVR